jgi:hypothetical protein
VLSKRTIFLLSLTALAVLICGCSDSKNGVHEKNPKVVRTESDFALDVNDPREVTGYASNVFWGKVTRERDHRVIDDLPETDFDVTVAGNIKGSVPAATTITQYAGQVDGTFVFTEDDAMIRPEKSYIFLVSFDPETGRYYVVAGSKGHIELPANPGPKLTDYRSAFEQQIPYEPAADRSRGILPILDLIEASSIQSDIRDAHYEVVAEAMKFADAENLKGVCKVLKQFSKDLEKIQRQPKVKTRYTANEFSGLTSAVQSAQSQNSCGGAPDQ